MDHLLYNAGIEPESKCWPTLYCYSSVVTNTYYIKIKIIVDNHQQQFSATSFLKVGRQLLKFVLVIDHPRKWFDSVDTGPLPGYNFLWL